jgi:hypothetical protein
MMAGEFGGVYFGPTGVGLGEPDYQGRTADESKPPGWTPNPAAWDPYFRTPGGDPFYSALNTAARQTQEPWRIGSKTSASRVLLAVVIDADFTSSQLIAPPSISMVRPKIRRR